MTLTMDCYTTHDYRESMIYRSVSSRVNALKPLIQEGDKKIINIHVSTRELPNDGENNPDFICAMSIFGENGWEQYARTEVSWKNKFHEWVRPLTITYDPNGLHLLHFDLYQITSDLFSLQHQKLVGNCEIDISTLINHKNRCIIVPISPIGADGNTFKAEEKYELTIKYSEIDLSIFGSFFLKASFVSTKSSHHFIKPHIFFTVERDGIPFYMSNALKLQSRVDFEPFEMIQQFACGKDKTSPVTFFIHKRTSTVETIGKCTTSIDKLTKQSETKLEVKDANMKTIGILGICFIGKVDSPRIDDIRLRGISVQAIYALDFSSGPNSCDAYRMVLNEVGDGLCSLTQCKPYYAFGFGVLNENIKQNLFSITHESDEVFSSIQRIMDEYRKKLLKSVSPRYSKLCPVIKHAKQVAVERWNQNKIFSVVIIISDGKMVDLEQAVELISSIDNFPLCFLIITVKTPKNPLIKTFAHHHGRVTNSQNSTSRRKIVKVLYYSNSLLNQLHSLHKARVKTENMIQDWFLTYVFRNK